MYSAVRVCVGESALLSQLCPHHITGVVAEQQIIHGPANQARDKYARLVLDIREEMSSVRFFFQHKFESKTTWMGERVGPSCKSGFTDVWLHVAKEDSGGQSVNVKTLHKAAGNAVSLQTSLSLLLKFTRAVLLASLQY